MTAVYLVGLVTAVSQQSGTFLGGNLTEKGLAITLDSQHNSYVTGYTESTTFPTSSQRLPEHGVDLFIAKFNPDQTQAAYLLWIDALSATDEDYGYSIAVAADGSAFVAGQTRSPDFCTFLGAVPGYDSSYNGGTDAFLLKIKPDGSGLDYCTFLGGDDWDKATAVAIDSTGNAYVSGSTWSTNFITSSNTINNEPAGLRDIFVLRIDPSGTAVLHASLIGGSGQEESKAISLDAQNNVHVTGWTNSHDFPTSSGVIAPAFNGEFDAFLLKINTITPTLQLATYLGGDGEDRGQGIAVDHSGHIYITGLTASADFLATPDSFDPSYNNGRDAFLTKLNPTGTHISYSTFLGGNNEDAANGLTLDDSNFAYIIGETHSANFPTTINAISPTLSGERAAFVTILDESGQHLAYSSFVGGSDWDQGFGVATLGDGRVTLTGATRSNDFPVSVNGFDSTHNGDYDVFVTSFNPGAQFTAVANLVTNPLHIQFTNLTPGTILSSTWDFGDGSSSQLSNPSHSYPAFGTFTATLTVTTPSKTSRFSQQISIQPQWQLMLPLVLRP